MTKMRWEPVLVPNAARCFLLVTDLNDHELVHEAEGTVDEWAVENHEAAGLADWAAKFFQDVAELQAALSLVL